MSTSPVTDWISVRRSSPKRFFMSSSSSLTMASTRASSARMASQFSILACRPASSSSILRISRPARRPSCSLTMASACGSSKPNCSMMAALASVMPPLQARMVAISSSTMSVAFFRPSRMWARSLAFFRSNWVRRRTTSSWNSTYFCSICFRVSTLGTLWSMASMMTPTVSCSWVYWYSWFRMTWALASLRTSTTMRMPLRLVSSFRPVMPSMRLSLTRSAMFSIRRALLTI